MRSVRSTRVPNSLPLEKHSLRRVPLYYLCCLIVGVCEARLDVLLAAEAFKKGYLEKAESLKN